MFTLHWLSNTQQKLEAIIERADNPSAVIKAMWELDRMLGSDPEGNSESRTGVQRVAFARPLGVFFEIYQAAGTVEIVDVWTIRPT